MGHILVCAVESNTVLSFYGSYLACFQVSSTFDYIFDLLDSFLFPCLYIAQFIISSLTALSISSLGHSETILLWFGPLASFFLGLDLQVGWLSGARVVLYFTL